MVEIKLKPKFKAPHKPSRLLAFEKIWKDLFTTPVHLDSALSRLEPEDKSVLAPMIQEILRRPVSLARELGVHLVEGEPWSISRDQLANWPSAVSIAREFLDGGQDSEAFLGGEGDASDFPPEMLDVIGEGALPALLSSPAPMALRLTKEARDLPPGARPSWISPWARVYEGYVAVLGTEAFKSGAFEIQDEGSQVMAGFALLPEVFGPLLRAEPGPVELRAVPVLPAAKFASSLKVVDACAGAGGKTLAMAHVLGGRGRVYAYDVSERKLKALARRASRAGVYNTQTAVIAEGEEQKLVEKFAGTADVVLVDAPCTGWGVLRRNPDIKWRQSAEELERLPQVQSRLLDAYSKLLKPGGRLVYGVCTFRPEETVAVVEEFLAAHSDFTRGAGGYLGPGPCDGFYMCELRRTSPTA